MIRIRYIEWRLSIPFNTDSNTLITLWISFTSRVDKAFCRLRSVLCRLYEGPSHSVAMKVTKFCSS